MKHNRCVDLIFHFAQLLVDWLPDNVFFLRLRGSLLRPFFGSCGENLIIERCVLFRYPANIHIGNNVFIGHGCCFLAATDIHISDEVMFGPYCIIAAANHTRIGRSFRFGPTLIKPIHIERGSWLASRVVLTPGCSIGKGCCIAAGAVVVGKVDNDQLMAGVPARSIKELSAQELQEYI